MHHTEVLLHRYYEHLPATQSPVCHTNIFMHRCTIKPVSSSSTGSSSSSSRPVEATVVMMVAADVNSGEDCTLSFDFKTLTTLQCVSKKVAPLKLFAIFSLVVNLCN